jgi:hypothetical protein
MEKRPFSGRFGRKKAARAQQKDIFLGAFSIFLSLPDCKPLQVSI